MRSCRNSLSSATAQKCSSRLGTFRPILCPTWSTATTAYPTLWATALQRKQREKEKEHREMESKLARIRGGGSLGRQRANETKRDNAARDNAALLADVREYRAKHPSHGGPAIAEALVAEHGRIRDHADPRSRKKAIEALRKRIERLERRSLDT
jgi:hypothetical protein